jgi:phi LC3 family holin
VPAVLLLIQLLLKPLGFNLDIDFLGGYFLDVVNAVFVLLTILGVVNDPTVFGFKDSEQALNYEEPKKD